MLCCFPYGAIIVTAIFAFYCCFILLNFDDEVACSTESDNDTNNECRVEGVDNAPVAYLCQFLLGSILNFLGLHLVVSNTHKEKKEKEDEEQQEEEQEQEEEEGGRAVSCRSAMAFFLWATSHAVKGIVGMDYGNDGTGDGKGQRGYFLLTVVIYSLHTLAVIEIANFAIRRIWPILLEEYKHYVFGKETMRILQGIHILVLIMLFIGSLWCGFTPNVWVDTSLDKYPNDLDLPVHQCVKMVDTARLVYTTAAAGIFIAVAALFGALADQSICENDQWYYVWGMPTSIAAASVVACQSTIIFFHIFAYVVLHNNVEAVEPDYAISTAGSIANLYADLMTAFFIHSLIYSMSLRSHDGTDTTNNTPTINKGDQDDKNYDTESSSVSVMEESAPGILTTMTRRMSTMTTPQQEGETPVCPPPTEPTTVMIRGDEEMEGTTTTMTTTNTEDRNQPSSSLSLQHDKSKQEEARQEDPTKATTTTSTRKDGCFVAACPTDVESHMVCSGPPDEFSCFLPTTRMNGIDPSSCSADDKRISSITLGNGGDDGNNASTSSTRNQNDDDDIHPHPPRTTTTDWVQGLFTFANDRQVLIPNDGGRGSNNKNAILDDDDDDGEEDDEEDDESIIIEFIKDHPTRTEEESA